MYFCIPLAWTTSILIPSGQHFYLMYVQRIVTRATCFDGSWSSSGTINCKNKNIRWPAMC